MCEGVAACVCMCWGERERERFSGNLCVQEIIHCYQRKHHSGQDIFGAVSAQMFSVNWDVRKIMEKSSLTCTTSFFATIVHSKKRFGRQNKTIFMPMQKYIYIYIYIYIGVDTCTCVCVYLFVNEFIFMIMFVFIRHSYALYINLEFTSCSIITFYIKAEHILLCARRINVKNAWEKLCEKK